MVLVTSSQSATPTSRSQRPQAQTRSRGRERRNRGWHPSRTGRAARHQDRGRKDGPLSADGCLHPQEARWQRAAHATLGREGTGEAKARICPGQQREGDSSRSRNKRGRKPADVQDQDFGGTQTQSSDESPAPEQSSSVLTGRLRRRSRTASNPVPAIHERRKPWVAIKGRSGQSP